MTDKTAPNRRSFGSVLVEVLALLVASFRPEGKSGRFLPFDVYPSKFRPPMTKSGR
jgi:hypothetical protein